MKKTIAPIVLALLLIGAGAYFVMSANRSAPRTNVNTQQTTNTAPPVISPLTIPTAQASRFAAYVDEPVTVIPNVPAYSINQDLGNVVNRSDFDAYLTSASAKELLAKNAFVVQPGFWREFYPLYEANRYAYIPNFITTDSLLHNYHLVFDHVLRKLEENQLSNTLKELTESALAESRNQLQALAGTDWENAAKRNVAFFSVAAKLLDDAADVPGEVRTIVEEELTRITAHEQIEESSIINLGQTFPMNVETPQGTKKLDKFLEDYSQYVPRGHYDKSNALKAYFKAMMWYGRMTFRFRSPDETRSALLMTTVLNDPARMPLWDAIYEPTTFFVGNSDDTTVYDLSRLAQKVYGSMPTTSEVISNASSFKLFQNETQSFDPPKINSIPIFESSIQPDREEQILSFRFMGQRFTVDGSIMQRLVCRDVGNKHGTMDCGGTVPDSRMLPRGLDIPAAFGSKEALNILESDGETAYLSYPQNMQTLRDYIANLTAEHWSQNLYWGWLSTLRPFTKEKGEGFPSFMRNTSWQRKELNTFLGSWAELKHDTILYAKQVYAELGGGPPDEHDDRGYVEPNPQVFGRLASLLAMTRDGLDRRAMLSESTRSVLEKMETLARSLRTIAEKELEAKSLTDEDYNLIRSYGGQLEHFWLEVNREEIEASGTDQRNYLDQNPAAVIADVATDPNGQVLEEGIGYINEMFVVVPIDGQLRLTKGGVFSYYEFPWPLNNRLTDSAWRKLLESDEKPALPAWTSEFIASEG